MIEKVLCAHCGEIAPAGSPSEIVDGENRIVCCAGCAAAARWIRTLGLSDYYRLRTDTAPRPEASGTTEDYSAWLHPDVFEEHVRPVAGGLEVQALTDAMRCSACAWLIDHALRGIPGVLDAGANAVTGRVRITWDPDRASLPDLLMAIDRLGFPLHLATGVEAEARLRAEKRRDVLRLGVAGLGAMQAMMLAEAVYLDTLKEMAIPTRDFIRWVTFLVSTPVVFFSGWPFIAGMWRDLRARHLTMDTSVGGSILLAYGASLIETVRGGPEVWFDAAVMFVLLLLTARQLEKWARRRANDQVDVMARTRPALAWRDGVGGRERVAVRSLQVGDVLHVAPGEVVPTDGTLLVAASLDESLLTGESLPVEKLSGDAVLAGSLCHSHALSLRVTAVGRQTYLSTLLDFVEQAQRDRPKVARLADRVASGFVTGLLIVAAAVFAYWWQHDPTRAFPITLAVLVVSCPCALSLAIPTALTSAYSQLAGQGVLTRRADALDRLADVDAVMFDKTGTLTRGEPHVVNVETFDGWSRHDAEQIAAALQQGSNHTLARAFRVQAALPFEAERVRTVTGEGIEGTIQNAQWRLGRAEFAAAAIEDDGAIWLGDGNHAIARFEVVDALRDDASNAVRALGALGIAVELSSGDSQSIVTEVAIAVGISQASARQTPNSKLDRARQRQRNGECVAMVGDGINDALVLAGADVSFAFARGAAAAHRSADFIIASDALMRVPQTILLARRTRKIIRQNLTWAIVYNVVAIPFAAAGLVEPWVAALGMATSSLGVSLNALRLRNRLTVPA